MTLIKRMRPVKKSSKLCHVSRKICVKIVALELLAQKDLMQIWCNGDMTHECPAAVPSWGNLTLRRMDTQVVGVTLGPGSGGPSCCLSAEHQARGHRMLSLSHSLRQRTRGGGICRSCESAISVMSGSFLHNCITPTSPKCIKCYIVMNIADSA